MRRIKELVIVAATVAGAFALAPALDSAPAEGSRITADRWCC